ncbi:hypothetical protein AMECASPLE_038693 [Ameca splendens]|uniref:Uncharacterized protein n=1 Tax=Ameca splendens TaxID=208324 RepID=A0ABV0XLA5_9TELE
MSDEAVPHVSLSLHPEHQAKELGGVVKLSGSWGLAGHLSHQLKIPAEPETRVGTSTSEAEWVLLKVIKWKWSEPRWTGPFQVTERTTHAVRLKETRGRSQCAEAPEPGRPLEEIRENTASSQGAE